MEPVWDDFRVRDPAEPRRGHAVIPASTLASRRGLREDQRGEAPPLAGCRSRGRGSGKLRHEAQRQESGVEPKVRAAKFLRKSLRRHGLVDSIVTDRLASYGAALKAMNAIDKRETGRWLYNRAENSHQPFRRRERAMLRFRRMRSLQKFAAMHGSIDNDIYQERHLSSRPAFKERRTAALNERRKICAA